jgi:hypothetical protein
MQLIKHALTLVVLVHLTNREVLVHLTNREEKPYVLCSFVSLNKKRSIVNTTAVCGVQ